MKMTLIKGDCLKVLPTLQAESIDLVITSPPYWGLRDYGIDGQLGNEETMEAYLDNLLKWVRDCYRVLKPSGSFVLNIGDCYFTKRNKNQCEQVSNSIGYVQRRAGFPTEYGIYKTKQLLSISSFAYCRIVSETDFVCRGEHIWCKPNVPSPIRSRLKHSHEKLFWFVKDADKYYFNSKVWEKLVTETSNSRFRYGQHLSAGQKNIMASISTTAFAHTEGNKHLIGTQTIEHSWRIISVGEKQKGFELSDKLQSEHIAPFPSKLINPYITSLCPPDGVVLDPFLGSGTVMRLAMENNRNCIGIELNSKYCEYAKKRVNWGNSIGHIEFKEEASP